MQNAVMPEAAATIQGDVLNIAVVQGDYGLGTFRVGQCVRKVDAHCALRYRQLSSKGAFTESLENGLFSLAA